MASFRSRQYSLISPGYETSVIPHDEFFYVNLKSAYYVGEKENFNPLEFLLYAKEDGPGTDCKIQLTESNHSTEDLHCMLEVPEGDLWMHEMILEYNVPPGMCHYLSFQTHWHYNYEVDNGPKYVVQVPSAANLDKDGVPEPRYKSCINKESADEACKKVLCPSQKESDPCPGCDYLKVEGEGACKNTKCTTEESCEDPKHACNSCEGADCTPEASTWTDNRSFNCRNDTADLKENAEDACPYIYSKKDEKINCCLGKYNLYEHKELKAKDTGIDWGGDVQNCIGGLAKISWDSFDEKGFPKSELMGTKDDGINREYTIPALIEKVDQADGKYSFPTANCVDNDSNECATNDTDFPSFFNSPSSDSETQQKMGNKYIRWACLDQAYEVRHRIFLTIREWNTQKEFVSFKESGRGNPNIDEKCEYYDDDSDDDLKDFEPCNDLKDLKDMGNDYPKITYK